MEVGEVVATATATAGGSGGLIIWFIKRTVTEIFEDLKGLSIKIDKVDDKYATKICDLEREVSSLKAQVEKK